MATIVDLLDNMPGKPGIKGRLVDDEGFPRDDCDILEVRKQRHRFACLQTDYSALMKEIENKLFGLQAMYKEVAPADKPEKLDPAPFP